MVTAHRIGDWFIKCLIKEKYIMNDDDKKTQRDDAGNLINAKTKKKIDADGNEPDDEVPHKASDKAVNSPTDVITNALYGLHEENEAKVEAAARATRAENAAAGMRPKLEPISKTSTSGRIDGGKPSDTSDAAPASSGPCTPFSTNPFKKKPEPK